MTLAQVRFPGGRSLADELAAPGSGVPGNFHWREALAICQAAGIPDLVGHHVGMFDFNTLSEAVLDAAIAANRSEVTWRKPRPDSRLELVQAKGRT